MKFVTESYKRGDIILNDPQYKPLFDEIKSVIEGITEEDIKERHQKHFHNKMSLSLAINSLLKERFVENEWREEAPIFQGDEFKDSKWRLDFAKEKISIEVAFNHGEAIAWNLIKPVLASEQNHVQKAIQTDVAVLICATKKLKEEGAFDGAVGEFEKICRYLIPLDRILTVPMVIIGLKAPETFKLIKNKVNGRNIGQILQLSEKDIISKNSRLVLSPYSLGKVSVPLVGSAPCGNPLLGEENIEEYIDVEKSKIKPSYSYFILRATGDSMNLAGINDGDLVLCRQQLKADTGNRVVALLGDNVTIKEYGPRENGVRLLLPKSTNPDHQPIVPEEGDSVQGIVQEIIERAEE